MIPLLRMVVRAAPELGELKVFLSPNDVTVAQLGTGRKPWMTALRWHLQREIMPGVSRKEQGILVCPCVCRHTSRPSMAMAIELSPTQRHPASRENTSGGRAGQIAEDRADPRATRISSHGIGRIECSDVDRGRRLGTACVACRCRRGTKAKAALPDLQEIHPEHHLQRQRQSTALRSRLGIVRSRQRHQRQQPTPRHPRLHPCKERFAPCAPLFQWDAEALKGGAVLASAGLLVRMPASKQVKRNADEFLDLPRPRHEGEDGKDPLTTDTAGGKKPPASPI